LDGVSVEELDEDLMVCGYVAAKNRSSNS
jgi:hypothetical protein